MNDWTLTISTAELRAAMNAIVDHIEGSSGETVELSEDYFWWVHSGTGFDPDFAPAPTIGQNSEVWSNLERERKGDREHTITYSAVWLGQILAAIGSSRP